MIKKKGDSPLVLYKSARDQEQQKSYAEATRLYALVLKIDPLHIDASNRLMIVYRKLKAYRKEVAVITKAIAIHQKEVKKNQRALDKIPSKNGGLVKVLGTISWFAFQQTFASI